MSTLLTNVLARNQRQQLRTTAMLIRRHGQDITLHRPLSPQSDGAGGVLQRVQSDDDPVLEPQTIYVGGKINNRMNNLPFEAFTAIGEYTKAAMVIIGMPMDKWELTAFDVQENDWFELDGQRYFVNFVHHDRRYQVKAECSYWGT